MTAFVRTWAVVFLAAGTLAALAAPSRAMRFSHVIHEKQGIESCPRCHVRGARNIIPERAVCLECHEEGEIAETVLGPARTHTPLWVTEHGTESRSADARCSSCHDLPFCADCHLGGELGTDLKAGTARPDTAPRTHTSSFRVVHPLKALGGRSEQCYACHGPEECSDCHESYRSRFPARELVSHQKNWQALIAGPDIPDHNTFALNQCRDCHPGGALSDAQWSGGHAREARRSLDACRSCHPEGAACLSCHSARTGLMVSPHPRNWKSIQGKFRRESPEVCAKCH